VYAVGGYNEKKGALDSVEVFSFNTLEWKQLAPMNKARINSGSCTFGKNMLYVFGGRSTSPNASDFYNSIERLNTDLNLWSYVEVKLPTPLCNVFAFPVQQDYIIIMGGLTRNSSVTDSSGKELTAEEKKEKAKE